MRLLTNKVFMFNFGSSLFYVFAFMGFGTFMPKYMEYQYRMKGSTSSAFAGAVGTVSKAIGLLISCFYISRWKPSARFLSGWNVILGTWWPMSSLHLDILWENQLFVYIFEIMKAICFHFLEKRPLFIYMFWKKNSCLFTFCKIFS